MNNGKKLIKMTKSKMTKSKESENKECKSKESENKECKSKESENKECKSKIKENKIKKSKDCKIEDSKIEDSKDCKDCKIEDSKDCKIEDSKIEDSKDCKDSKSEDSKIIEEMYKLDDNILTKLKLFVCTQSAKITDFNYSMEDFTKMIKNNLPDFILSLNTNYVHICQPGCEAELKLNSKKKKNKVLKKRQTQGDETIFHSAIQLNIILNSTIENYLSQSKAKVYKIKLYPSTGKIQIPGIIKSDLSDGIEIINKLIDYINSLPLPPLPGTEIVPKYEIEDINTIMINYKTSLKLVSQRILFNLNSIGEYIQLLEYLYIYEDMSEKWAIPIHEENSFKRWEKLILPPFLISDTKLKNNDKHISFTFIPLSTEIKPKKGKIATIKIFQQGKINILGIKNEFYANQIYIFLKNIIRYNIKNFIVLKMIPDVDMHSI